ncbi:oligoribonuclease [Trypanosoma rangeli]|uniref:Fanconi-associated nuclease n=1 Tax=Trypanosoma rangeli TaxID=5698 RepID=A0A3R7NAS8_TRYRA|nr:oligoribonuclease [Trypanosoma rangeli]RNF03376.1 oligoribonuclease [Trypanosoma rangeli]|eukprot:RNF03376.1 oligoribonuclease [Trypanosoma rangeli]
MLDEDGVATQPTLWQVSPTPMLEAFHDAIWYILQYCGSAIEAAELLSWRTLLQLPLRAAVAGVHGSARRGEELELLLRLALRVPTWMRVRQLEEQYAEYMHFRPALDRLSALCVGVYNDGCETRQDETFVRLLDGAAVAELVVVAKCEGATELLRVARVRDLRQLLLLLCAGAGRGKRVDGGEQDANAHRCNDGDGEAVGDNPVRAGIHGATAGRRSTGDVRRLSTALPLRKEDIIRRILDMDCAAALFSATWDAVVGPVCRVHEHLKKSVCRVAELLHVLASPCGTGGVFSVLGRSYPPRPLSAALSLLAPKLLLWQTARVSCVPTPPWWHTNGVASEEPSSRASAPLCLFTSPESLASYMGALELHQALLEATAGKMRRGGGLHFAMASHTAVEDSLTRLQQQQSLRRKREHPESTASEPEPSNGSVPSGKRGSSEAGAVTVELLLQQGGLLYEHLLPFLPKYAWFACAELLVLLLQFNKEYALANQWLQTLLGEPVHVVASACGSVKFPFYYRSQKRGKWCHRVAQNLVLLGDRMTALEMLERQQQNWRQQSSRTPECVCVEDAKRLPVGLQRRARLLSAVFPSPKGSRGGENKVAVYNAINEYHRRHFCRRFDRIAIERTLASLHRLLRRWTPFPASHMSFTNHLLAAKEVTIHAARDTMDPTLWSDPSHSMTACRVEKHVLRWFGAGRSSRSGWVGLHCEGRWFACLARLLLWDAYVFDPTPQRCREAEQETVAGVSDYIWLSPLQDDPFDLIAAAAFCHRRRRLIEARLEFFEACPREIIIEYVRRRCRSRETPTKGTGPVREGKQAREELQLETESDASLWSMDEEEKGGDGMVLPGQPMPPQGEQLEETLPAFFACDDACALHMVDVGELPLLSLLRAIPQRPLCALLRCMFLSPPEEGHTVCFAGFPDLVLWRETPLSLLETDFKLVEVKSPHDALSDKQLAAIDALCRCGFDVSVARIVESSQAVNEAGPCGAHTSSSDRVQDAALRNVQLVL